MTVLSFSPSIESLLSPVLTALNAIQEATSQSSLSLTESSTSVDLNPIISTKATTHKSTSFVFCPTCPDDSLLNANAPASKPMPKCLQEARECEAGPERDAARSYIDAINEQMEPILKKVIEAR